MSNHFDIRRVGIAYIIILEYKLHRLHKSSTPELYLFGNAICTRVWIVSHGSHLILFFIGNAICTRVWIVSRWRRRRIRQSPNAICTRVWIVSVSCATNPTNHVNAICTRVWIVRGDNMPRSKDMTQCNLYAGMNCESAPQTGSVPPGPMQFVRGYELWESRPALRSGIWKCNLYAGMNCEPYLLSLLYKKFWMQFVRGYELHDYVS